jgi:uncharacterized protein YbbC (DUF1343 family)
MKKLTNFFLILAALVVASVASAAEYPDPASMATPVVAPSELSMDAASLDRIDAIVEDNIRAGNFPGAVVAVGRGNKLAFLRAYGDRQTEPVVEPCTIDTVYDLASLTKVTATAIGIAILVERGEIGYDDPVTKYFPEFGQKGKESITIRDCLTHVSGLTPDNSLKDYIGFNREEILDNICKLGLVTEPGETFSYSDVGFILMGYLIEKITGQSEDEFVRENIYLPLGMVDTGFNPNAEQKSRAAAAEKRHANDEDWIKGEVHDPRAYELDGIAGHAGNFSTAPDLAILASMLIGHGTYAPASGAEPVTILKPETFKLMTEPVAVPRGIRSRGWDKRSPYSNNRAALMSPEAIGHSGFTGTSIWIDPGTNLFVIFLGNRLHPDGKGDYVTICGKIGQTALDSIYEKADPVAAKAFVERSVYRSPNASKTSVHGETLTGADVLARDEYAPLKGLRVGLLTNQTGLLKDGSRLPKAMQEGGVALTTLFSPEHGLYGELDQSNIDDARDPETGLKVYSLYGATRRPSPESLEDVDAFVFDIQDVGVRYYTYISAMCSAMQSCADLNKKFVVLDRPNPISGVKVEGPFLDPGRESYVAFFPMPIQHGMTVGELALAFAFKYNLNLDLTVIPCENWTRDQYFDETGLAWVNPSPNMRSLDEALLYPGIGIPEFTNISVGRGTATPFEVVGAPWIDGADLAAKMTELKLGGVAFEATKFTPDASKYKDEEVSGIRMKIVDRSKLDAVRLGIALMTQLAKDYPEWELRNANTLLLNDATLDAIKSGRPLDEIVELWSSDLARFNEFRANFLIY